VAIKDAPVEDDVCLIIAPVVVPFQKEDVKL
jgi:hypothetical protein